MDLNKPELSPLRSYVEVLSDVTPVILTLNEEANIGRTLDNLRWARRVVVVDSFSTDSTLDILSRYSNVSCVKRVFDTHANQWNHALFHVRSTWALCLDADYQISPNLVNEISQSISDWKNDNVTGYVMSFQYLVRGQPLRGSVYPPKLVMFKPSCGRFIDDGHTQLPVVSGLHKTLRCPIAHDDRKPLKHWFWAQERYHWLEGEKLLQTPSKQLGWIDLLRKHTPLAPLMVVVAILILKRGILDGRAGWFYALQRGYAELQIWLIVQELRSKRYLL